MQKINFSGQYVEFRWKKMPVCWKTAIFFGQGLVGEDENCNFVKHLKVISSLLDAKVVFFIVIFIECCRPVCENRPAALFICPYFPVFSIIVGCCRTPPRRINAFNTGVLKRLISGRTSEKRSAVLYFWNAVSKFWGAAFVFAFSTLLAARGLQRRFLVANFVTTRHYTCCYGI